MITLTGNSEVENEVTLQPLLRITKHPLGILRITLYSIQSIQSIHNIHFVEHFTFNKLLKYFKNTLKKP